MEVCIFFYFIQFFYVDHEHSFFPIPKHLNIFTLLKDACLLTFFLVSLCNMAARTTSGVLFSIQF
jgi:hypothetical protein